MNNLPNWVVYRDVPYPLALHPLEARKFLDHRPDLAVKAVRARRVGHCGRRAVGELYAVGLGQHRAQHGE